METLRHIGLYHFDVIVDTVVAWRQKPKTSSAAETERVNLSSSILREKSRRSWQPA